MTDSPRSILRRLQELIAALDRRRPLAQRDSEAAIARDSAALKADALAQIAELNEPASATPPAPPTVRST